jgi:hypothetical protein
MRQIRNKAIALIASTGLCLGLTLAMGAAPAFAQTQICGNQGSGYCMNDWNNGGYGNPVKMYNGNVSNEDFWVQKIDRCAGGSTVTSSCPFNDHNIDAGLGGTIFQIRYANTSLCLAANTANGQSVLGACNSVNTGTGGDTGTVYVGGDFTLFSVYYTNLHNNGDLYCVESGGNPGQPVYLNVDFFPSGCTEWGGTGV